MNLDVPYFKKKIEIPKDIRDKWLASLRSKKYKKGSMALFSIEKAYCCLGVLGKCLGFTNEFMQDETYLGNIPNHSFFTRSLDDTLVYGSKNQSFCHFLSLLNDYDGSDNARKTLIKEYNYKVDEDKISFSFEEIADIIQANTVEAKTQNI